MSKVKCQRSVVNCRQKGSILLEALIAIMVLSFAFTVILDVGTLSVKTSTSIQKNSQANFLLKEEMEAARTYRDGTTWTSATNPIGLGTVNTGSDNPYYFVLDTGVNPNKWVLTSGTETIGIFTRRIVFDQVYRDSNSNIVSSGGTLDNNTKKVTATVSWPEKTLNLMTYLTNWK